MTQKQVQTISFFVILLLAFILVVAVFKPFISILALAIILAILFNPVYQWLLARTKQPTLSSLLTILVVLLILIIPLAFFGQVLFNEIVNVYERLRSGELVLNREQIVNSLPPQVQTYVESFSRDINRFLGSITSNAFNSVTSVLSNVAGFFVALVITFFSLFYLLKDGKHIKQVLMDIWPMADKQENILLDKIAAAVNGVVKGSFLTALLQGIVAMVGFFIFGIPDPVVWGLFTILAALVPTIGTALVLVPAVIYLFLTGNVPQAIGLAIWGAVAVGLIDNFIGPRIVGSRTQLHPLLVLLSVLGGIQLFGFLGFLIGPILMAIFVALIDMYRTDFKTMEN
jgi:predicted PurR-regulated permease PerM